MLIKHLVMIAALLWISADAQKAQTGNITIGNITFISITVNIQ